MLVVDIRYLFAVLLPDSENYGKSGSNAKYRFHSRPIFQFVASVS